MSRLVDAFTIQPGGKVGPTIIAIGNAINDADPQDELVISIVAWSKVDKPTEPEKGGENGESEERVESNDG